MGNYMGSIQLRDATLASTASLIAAYDKLEEAILGCGMLRATEVEDPGQAGTWVAGTAGAGETTVPAPTNSNTAIPVGYRTYKLPDSLAASNPMMVRCYYLICQSSNSQRCAAAAFGVRFGSSAWTPDLGPLHGGLYTLAAGTMSSVGIIPAATSFPLIAACGEGYFHLSVIAANGYKSNAPTSPAVDKAAVIGVFAARGFINGEPVAATGVHCAPAILNYASSTSAAYYGSSTPPSIALGSSSSPVGVLTAALGAAGTSWYPTRAAVFPGLGDESITAADGGLRCLVPKITSNGKLVDLPCAVTVLANAPIDAAQLEVPLWGDPVPMIVSHAFIRVCRDGYYTGWSAPRPQDSSLLLLPW